MATTSRLKLIDESLTDDLTSTSKSLSQEHKNFLGFIKTTATNAATTVNGKIQHSPNGTDWFDVVSFTAIAGTNTSEVKTISGSLFANIRAVVTLAGATKASHVQLDLWFDPGVR